MNFYTIEDLTKLLKLNHMTIRGYIKAGELPAFKLQRSIRVSEDDLLKFLESHRFKRINKKIDNDKEALQGS